MADPTGRELLFVAATQIGDPYIYGREASPANPNPYGFDCSELPQWAAGRLDRSIPDGAQNQWDWCRAHDLAIPYSQAIHVAGALIFASGSSHGPSGWHVAICCGDGKSTMEARGKKWGVNRFPLAGRNFNRGGGLVLGFDYLTPPEPAPPPIGHPPVAPAGMSLAEQLKALAFVIACWKQRTLRHGDRSDGVALARTAIRDHWGYRGLTITPSNRDWFDDEMLMFVHLFQAHRGLTQNGVVGPETWRFLYP
jgi:hypothetical protein